MTLTVTQSCPQAGHRAVKLVKCQSRFTDSIHWKVCKVASWESTQHHTSIGIELGMVKWSCLTDLGHFALLLTSLDWRECQIYEGSNTLIRIAGPWNWIVNVKPVKWSCFVNLHFWTPMDILTVSARLESLMYWCGYTLPLCLAVMEEEVLG